MAKSVISTLVYTRVLIRERIHLLQSLDKRKKAIPPSDYLSCRRSLLKAIEELRTVLSRAEYGVLTRRQGRCLVPVTLAGWVENHCAGAGVIGAALNRST